LDKIICDPNANPARDQTLAPMPSVDGFRYKNIRLSSDLANPLSGPQIARTQPSSLQNIRLSADAANLLSKNQRWQADGDG